jgi:hypothetical protein
MVKRRELRRNRKPEKRSWGSKKRLDAGSSNHMRQISEWFLNINKEKRYEGIPRKCQRYKMTVLYQSGQGEIAGVRICAGIGCCWWR